MKSFLAPACLRSFYLLAALLLPLDPAHCQTTNAPATNAPPTKTAPVVAQPPQVETLICFRHGERTDKEIGQLKIQGLNRALALPKLLLSRYGKPQYLFAPDPSEKIGNPPVCYVRPLAAIEPTAIYCDLPVNTLFGFRHIQQLETEIKKPLYANSLIFICWEHHFLEKFVRQVIVDYGAAGEQVPAWVPDDYDTIYIVKIRRQDGSTTAEFGVEKENLNNLSGTFPGPAPALPPGH